MKRYLMFSLLMFAALACGATPAFARGGGGHGGGHHGGGHHGGGHHGGNHHNGHHDHHHSHHASHHHNHHSYHHHGDHHAFAHGWGGGHRGAWGWGGVGWGWGNPWAAAGWGAAAGWLGMDALNGAGYGYPATTQVVTSDNSATEPTNQVADNTTPETEYPAAEASQLANNGAQEPGTDARFLPLGVYSIAPQGSDEATGLVQLAVSKEGVLRGTFVDAEDKDHAISGAVDKKTGRVAWTAAPNSKTVYHTTLQELTKESGPSPLLVSSEHGQAKWTIAHYKHEDEADDADDKSDGADGDDESENNSEESEEAQPTVQIKTGAHESHVPAPPVSGVAK
jgi:hypothetical protein